MTQYGIFEQNLHLSGLKGFNLKQNQQQIRSTLSTPTTHSSHERNMSQMENKWHSQVSSFACSPRTFESERAINIPTTGTSVNTFNVAAAMNTFSYQQSPVQPKAKKTDRPFKQKKFFEWIERPKKQMVRPQNQDLGNATRNSKQCPFVSDNCLGEIKKPCAETFSKNTHASIANFIQKVPEKNYMVSGGNLDQIRKPQNLNSQVVVQTKDKVCLLEAKRMELLRDLTYHRETRSKKTVFKTPAFLLDRADELPSGPRQKNLMKTSQSIPKSFKTMQQITMSTQSSEISSRSIGKSKKKCISTQKTLRSFTHRLHKKISLPLQMSGPPKTFEVGTNLKLKAVTNSYFTTFVELKVLKVLADNEGSSTYMVLEKQTRFLLCLKKTEIKSRNQSIDCMIRESKIGMFMDNCFLVKTYATLFDERNIYQLMELAPGATLHSHNKKQKLLQLCRKDGNKEESLHSLEHIRTVVFQLLQGIEYMHLRGITHRDLKPANIFLANDHAFKIGDFGCSIYKAPQDYVGTLDYAAPQIMLHCDHGPAVDMWAIGCIAYELYTGQPPFYHPGKQQTIQRIVTCSFNINKIGDLRLKDFISKLLLKDASKRMSSSVAIQHPFISTF